MNYEICECCGKYKLPKGKTIDDVGFRHETTWYHKLNTLSFWQILHKKRCSHIKFKRKTQFDEVDRLYNPGEGSSIKPEEYKGDLVPMCKYHDPDTACIKCPHTINEQHGCKYYVNNYPLQTHEDVLVFQK